MEALLRVICQTVLPETAEVCHWCPSNKLVDPELLITKP